MSILQKTDPEIEAAFTANDERLFERIRELLIRFNDRIEMENPTAAMFVLKYAVDGVINRLLEIEDGMEIHAVLQELSVMVLKYLAKTSGT